MLCASLNRLVFIVRPLIDGLSLQNEGKPAAKGGVALRDLPGIHARPLRSEVWRGERGRSVGA